MSNKDRFDKFDEQARSALQHAHEEAQRLQHNYIGTEHLLVGLIRDETNAAATILRNMNVDIVEVRNAVEFLISGGDRILTRPPIGLTPRSKKVIELSVDEARRLNHSYIGTEHLLLGMIREGEGIAAGVLESLGAHLEKARTATFQTLSLGTRPTPNVSTSTPLEQSASTPTPEQLEQSMNPSVPETAEATGPRKSAFVQTKSIKPYAGYPFTEQAHTILERAREEALRFSHNYIGTEHLLLGMVREGEGVAGAVLQNLGVDLNRVRSAVEYIIGRGDRVVLGEIGLTPRSKRILEYASDDAKKLNNAYVGTEHLLLGMVEEGEGIAAGVLNSLGVYEQNVRAETFRVLKDATYEK